MATLDKLNLVTSGGVVISPGWQIVGDGDSPSWIRRNDHPFLDAGRQLARWHYRSLGAPESIAPFKDGVYSAVYVDRNPIYDGQRIAYSYATSSEIGTGPNPTIVVASIDVMAIAAEVAPDLPLNPTGDWDLNGFTDFDGVSCDWFGESAPPEVPRFWRDFVGTIEVV